MLSGLELVRTTNQYFGIIASTLLIWVLNTCAYGLLVFSCSLPTELQTPAAAVLATLASAVSHAIPSTASGLGVFNYSVVIALESYTKLTLGETENHSAAIVLCSLIVYLAAIIPDIVVGGYFYLRKGGGMIIARRRLYQLSISILALLLTLATAEKILRDKGAVPGTLTGRILFISDSSLHLNACYLADSNGIMKFSPHATKTINDIVSSNIREHTLKTSANIKELYKEDFIQAYCDRNSNPEFTFWRDSVSLLLQKDSSLSPLVYYASHPINADGFRSIPFQANVKNKKKILLIGDSFTYGFSAVPITYSFYDQLLIKGHLVYNTGITCTDPVQYLTVIQTYITKIKPDIMVVSFFMGNDIMMHRRISKPFQFAAYPINNMFITANPYGDYLSPQDANLVMRLNNTIPNQDISSLNRFLAKTVLGTRLWIALSKLGICNVNDNAIQKFQNPAYNNDNPTEITRDVVKKIFLEAQTHHVKLIFTVIPDHAVTNPWNQAYNAKQLFQGIDVDYVPDSSEWFNPYPDGHFNNYGHKSYADWLEDKIKRLE